MSRQSFPREARLWASITAILTVIGLVIGYQQLHAANHPPHTSAPPPSASASAPNQTVTATGDGAMAIGQVNGDVTTGGAPK